MNRSELDAIEIFRRFVASAFVMSALLALPITHSLGQEVYQLVVPGISAPSFAVVHPNGMLMIRDAGNQETVYRHDERFDSHDTLWIGYYSRQARQALQWPSSNTGSMRIGTLDSNNSWSFRTSRMTIQSNRVALPNGPAGLQTEILPNHYNGQDRIEFQGQSMPFGGPGNPIQGIASGVLPMDPNQAPLPIQLGMGDPSRRRFLARNSFGGLGVVPGDALGSQNWYIVPLASGLARIQYYDNQSWLGLGCDPRTQALSLNPVGGNGNQLWRVNSFPGMEGAYSFESIAVPGYGLSYLGNDLRLAPISYAAYQQWWPTVPQIPVVQPMYRSISQNVISNPPLPPARVTLQNKHSDTLIVLVGDRRSGGSSQKIRIPSGGSEVVTLERDSGAIIVETFEVRSLNGFWERQESRTAIPPNSLYDISVYEVFLQSIAIDRTGSSPNPIEDINYQPRSVGLFVVPPGDQIAESGVLDVFRTATAARNPGAVRRLQQDDYEKPKDSSTTVDPLKAILKEFEGKRAAF